MSGGVDSSCAALLLKREGYEVLGASMKLLDGRGPGGEDAPPGARTCCSARDIADARAVCIALDMDFMVFNFSVVFWEEVVAPFIERYLSGMTPNPCILCNRAMKFRRLRGRGRLLGCGLMATGHYARTERSGGRVLLKKALDASKDQSYVLYAMTQEELAGTLFPVGGLSKARVRAIASEAGLPVASKPGSQDICFVPGGDYGEFLAGLPQGPRGSWPAGGGQAPGGRAGAPCPVPLIGPSPGSGEDGPGRACGGGDAPAGRNGYAAPPGTGLKPLLLRGPGDILDLEGRPVGRHKGLWRYTVGQRKGLGLPGPEPSYVVAVDPEANTITAGRRQDLAVSRALVGDLNLIALEKLTGPVPVKAKIRYRQAETPARLEPHGGGRALLVFRTPQSGVAPGQAAVFYDGDVVVGGGTILGTWKV
jgi:tRNA-specific 2-thiouridylase